MKQFLLLFLLAIVAVVFSTAQSQPATSVPPGDTQANTAIVNPGTQSPTIRILTPVAGQTLQSDFADLRFETVQPVLSGEPNFLIQIDGADPINTTGTEYTFTGLQPGIHSIRVTLVDANNSPIQGGAATVQFNVQAISQPARTNGSRGALVYPSQSIKGTPPAMPIPPELREDGDIKIPLAGSPLPALSLIGFGLLIGGAAQTMRVRKANRADS
jgi:hypothetical protein